MGFAAGELGFKSQPTVRGSGCVRFCPYCVNKRDRHTCLAHDTPRALLERTLSGKSPSRKATCCIIVLQCRVRAAQICRNREQISVRLGPGRVGKLGNRVSRGVMEQSKPDCGGDWHSSGYTKTMGCVLHTNALPSWAHVSAAEPGRSPHKEVQHAILDAGQCWGVHGRGGKGGVGFRVVGLLSPLNFLFGNIARLQKSCRTRTGSRRMPFRRRASR